MIVSDSFFPGASQFVRPHERDGWPGQRGAQLHVPRWARFRGTSAFRPPLPRPPQVSHIHAQSAGRQAFFAPKGPNMTAWGNAPGIRSISHIPRSPTPSLFRWPKASERGRGWGGACGSRTSHGTTYLSRLKRWAALNHEKSPDRGFFSLSNSLVEPVNASTRGLTDGFEIVTLRGSLPVHFSSNTAARGILLIGGAARN